MDSKLHPAMTVSNIKNLVPITLEVEAAHYTTWVELFQNSCTTYQVKQKALAATSSDTEAAKATVSTISKD
ncbi:hypothetical protein Hanom_Chr03g00186821 [Helianthus anomalus]